MTKMRFIDLHCDTVVCEVMRNEDSKNLRSNPTGMLEDRLPQDGDTVDVDYSGCNALRCISRP